jgi:hypothetical protein
MPTKNQVKLCFKTGEEIKINYDRQKLKKFMTPKPALQKILKGLLHTDEKEKQYSRQNKFHKRDKMNK